MIDEDNTEQTTGIEGESTQGVQRLSAPSVEQRKLLR